MRENMLIGTVLDSFCMGNYHHICGKDIVLGKIAAVGNFALQDFPQTIIHVLFLYIDKSHKVDHNDWTISTGLFVSCIALVFALWNACMFSENAFDPVVLELELMDR